MAEIGHGYSRQETINVASDYAHHLGLCDKSRRLSLQWFYNFLNRWPELKVKKNKTKKKKKKKQKKKNNNKKTRSLEIACAKSATRPVLMLILLNLAGFLTSIILRTNQIGYITLMRKGYQQSINPQESYLAPIIKLRP